MNNIKLLKIAKYIDNDALILQKISSLWIIIDAKIQLQLSVRLSDKNVYEVARFYRMKFFEEQ